MDFIKQYLVQSITYAAGNLRLNANQIETLALLKELLLKSDNLEEDLLKMKKITEFSTLAIKLHDLYLFLTRNTIDISTISDKFRVQSQTLVKDVNLLLYNTGTLNYKSLFERIKEDRIASEEKGKIKVENSFNHFEQTVLNPIKPIDAFLTELLDKDVIPPEIDGHIETMKQNSELSKKNGFEILSGMHSILFDSFNMIKNGKIKPDKETVESLRSCLIVVAAVVRGKEVNISDYLNRAGNFRKKIDSIKNKEE